MAQNTLFIAIASILQVFELSGPRDSLGKEQPVDYSFCSGVFTYVVIFDRIIRSPLTHYRHKVSERLQMHDSSTL